MISAHRFGIRKSLGVLALGALAMTLAACAGGQVTYNTDITSSYDKSDVLYATKDGPLPVETIGRTRLDQPLHDAALQERVAQGVDRFGPHWFVGGFAAVDPEAPAPRYRLRVVVNAPVSISRATLCAPDLKEQAAAWTEENGRVIAAFCLDGTALSVARASYGPPGAADPAVLPRFAGNLALQILPPRNPDRDRDDCRRFVSCG